MTEGRFYSWMRRGVRALEGARDTVELDVTIAGQNPVRATLPLAGPGQVEGLRKGAVARVDPARGSGDHRAGALPFVTFRDPALPWIMSHRAPDAQGRLTPWLALICVPQDRAVIHRGQMLDILDADDLQTEEGAPLLSDPADAYLGAHVHDPDGDAGDEAPGARAVSRLVCLQQLTSGTAYFACVVPVFEAGRRAGLELDPGDADGFAWDPTSPRFRTPVYHHWRFSCGPGRGVEDLLRDLSAQALDRSAMAEVAVSDRFSDPVPSLSGTKLPLRTLFSPLAPPSPVSARALIPALKATDGQGDVQLPLPSYGAAQAGAEDAGDDTTPRWFREVNRDPSLRRLAGVGAALVRAQQDAMVGFVRQSVGAIDEANAILGRAHAAKAMNRGLTAALGKADAPTLAHFAAPAADRMRVGSGVARKPLRDALAGKDLAILSAPGLTRRASRRGVDAAALAQAFVRVGTEMADGHDVAGAGIAPELATGMIDAGQASSIPAAEPDARKFADLLADLADNGLRDLDTRSVETPPEVTVWADGLRENSAQPSRRNGPGPVDDPLSLAQDIASALDPDRSVPPRIAARLDGAGIAPEAPLPARILTEPVWPDPVIDQVLKMAPDVLAPALSQMREDTIVGMRYDAAAMEAIMVGANHELMRELRWRGLPCDVAVSPVRRAFPAPTRGGALDPDLSPMRGWSDTPLGSHATQGANAQGAGVDFVAIMRSSLIRRFPDVTVTLNRATADGQGRVLDARRAPVVPGITGTLGEDLIYFGFPPVGDLMAGEGWFLTFTQPRVGLSFGINAPSDTPPRGVGELSSWNALSWSDLQGGTITRDALETTPLEGLRWGSGGAAMAGILLERPVTVGLHLSDLMTLG